MRRDFFSTSVASPAVQQLPASTVPVTVPVPWNPAHAPAFTNSGTKTLGPQASKAAVTGPWVSRTCIRTGRLRGVSSKWHLATCKAVGRCCEEVGRSAKAVFVPFGGAQSAWNSHSRVGQSVAPRQARPQYRARKREERSAAAVPLAQMVPACGPVSSRCRCTSSAGRKYTGRYLHHSVGRVAI